MPAPTSSPRPKARPDNLGKNSGGEKTGFLDRLKAAVSGLNFSGAGTGGAPTGKQFPNAGGGSSNRDTKKTTESAAPAAPPPPANDPNTVAKTPNAARAADTTILTKALRDAAVKGGGKSYRGSILSTLYGLPADSQRAVRTLQSFNGNQGSRLKLGQ